MRGGGTLASPGCAAGIAPRTIEAKIVGDVDRLNALGAVGPARGSGEAHNGNRSVAASGASAMGRASPSAEDCERIEQAAWMDLAEVVPAPVASTFGLESHRFRGTFQLLAARMPVYQFNWLNGAGLQGDDDAASIDLAVERFLASGQGEFFVQIPPGPHAAAFGTGRST